MKDLGQDALRLVLLQKRNDIQHSQVKAEKRSGNPGRQYAENPAVAKARHIDHAGQRKRNHNRSGQIWLHVNHPQGDGRKEGGRPDDQGVVNLLPVPGKEPGKDYDKPYLNKLRRLNLNPENLEPSRRALGVLADQEHRNKKSHAAQIDQGAEFKIPVVVDERQHKAGRQSD